MLAYYGTAISEHITKKPSGGIICTGVPVARTGAQEYLARELQLDGDPERLIQVSRKPDEVFSPAALASFEGCAVTDGHPPDSVTAENFSAYVRGHAQNVRREGDYVVADLHIDDASLASDVVNHVKREVSCGYMCTYEPDGNGYTQKGILGNHIAIVPRGRAGSSVSIKDAAQEAEKGRKYMSKFTEAILSAFGMAVKEAGSQEEIDALASTAATVLDAEPAPAADQEPAPAADETVENAPEGDGLGSKLDKLIEMVGSLKKDEKQDAGDALSDLEKELSGEKKEGEGKDADVIPAGKASDVCASSEAKDAALSIIRAMRPVVASIQDKETKAKVTDALLSAFRGPDVMGAIDSAAQASARKAADQAAATTDEQRCVDSQAAYAARNPHKRQEKEV